MSISWEGVNETLIEWTTDIQQNGSGKKTVTCKVKSSKGVFYFDTSCKYKCVNQYQANALSFGFGQPINQSATSSTKYEIEMCLTLVEPPINCGNEGELFPSREGEASSLNNPAVFCSVNGCEKTIMKKALLSHEWSANITFESKLPTLNCVFWINFNDFIDAGEANLIKHLTDMFVQQNYCDVQFTFDGNQSIGGHVNVLAARSPVFAAMFQHQMQEAKTGKVTINDVQLNIFKEMLHYIYSGRVRNKLTEETALPLYVAADKYDIDDLRKLCTHFLVGCVKVNNVLNLLVWAHLHSVEELKEKTLAYIARYGAEVCELNDWENFIKNYPDLCLLATRRMMKTASAS